jgi:hypothetical protein
LKDGLGRGGLALDRDRSRTSAFKHRRLSERIGHIRPAEAEANYDLQPVRQAFAA